MVQHTALPPFEIRRAAIGSTDIGSVLIRVYDGGVIERKLPLLPLAHRVVVALSLWRSSWQKRLAGRGARRERFSIAARKEPFDPTEESPCLGLQQALAGKVD